MVVHQSLTPFAELLHRALKAQMHYAQDHPQAIQSMEAAHAMLTELLAKGGPIVITSSRGRLWHEGRPVEGAPNAAQALSKEMDLRGIGGVAFHQGVDQDELQLFFFALQLKPQRLQEMGGARSLLPEDSNLRILDLEPPEPITLPSPPTDPDPMGFGLDPHHGSLHRAGAPADASSPVGRGGHVPGPGPAAPAAVPGGPGRGSPHPVRRHRPDDGHAPPAQRPVPLVLGTAGGHRGTRLPGPGLRLGHRHRRAARPGPDGSDHPAEHPADRPLRPGAHGPGRGPPGTPVLPGRGTGPPPRPGLPGTGAPRPVGGGSPAQGQAVPVRPGPAHLRPAAVRQGPGAGPSKPSGAGSSSTAGTSRTWTLSRTRSSGSATARTPSSR